MPDTTFTSEAIHGLAAAPAHELSFLAAEQAWIGEARVKEVLPITFGKALFMTGRGWGKTKSICSWGRRQAGMLPGSIGHVVAPTFSDLRGTLFFGATGLLNCIPPSMIEGVDRTHWEIMFKNGTLLRGFSAQEPDRMRGPQCHWLFADEIATWTYLEDMMSNIDFSTRLVYERKNAEGAVIERVQPQRVYATTPRPLEMIRTLAEDPKVHQVRGSLYENRANLAETFIEDVAKHEGTKLGDQEIHGKILDFDETAIIKKRWLRLWPHGRPLPQFEFIFTSLDTAFTEESYDKKKNEPDPTACTTWGVFIFEKKMNLMLINSWHDLLGMPELIERAKEELRIEYGHTEVAPRTSYVEQGQPPQMIRVVKKPALMIIEDKGSGISLRQMLAKEKLGVPIHPYNPGKASKMARLNAVAHVAAGGSVAGGIPIGRIWLVESADKDKQDRPKHVSWADAYVAEVCQYNGPGSTKYDDYVDTTSQAWRYFADNYLPASVADKIAKPAPRSPPPSNPYG